MATHSDILAWRIPTDRGTWRTGVASPMGLQGAGHGWATEHAHLEYNSLCCSLAVYPFSIYDSLHPLIPNSHSFPPSPRIQMLLNFGPLDSQTTWVFILNSVHWPSAPLSLRPWTYTFVLEFPGRGAVLCHAAKRVQVFEYCIASPLY